MPDDGSKLADLASLAEASARVELAVPVAGLERLVALLASTGAVARGQIDLGMDRGHIVARVEAAADLEVVCQRCLQRFVLPVQGSSEVALVPSETQVDRVPADLETMLAPEGRLRLRELVEEELLLALPGAPMHAEGECGVAAANAIPEVPVQRPFAALGDLLGADRKN